MSIGPEGSADSRGPDPDHRNASPRPVIARARLGRVGAPTPGNGPLLGRLSFSSISLRTLRTNSRSPLEDAFAHHLWATLRVLDACAALSAEQLGTIVPSTDRSILDTARHFVGGDALYLFWLTEDRTFVIDADAMDLAALRSAMARHEVGWSKLLSLDLDPDTVVKDIDEDYGYQRDAPVGIRLAQALHHGTDHRSQISTALTLLGVEPPAIDVWNYGIDTGRVTDILPPS